MRELGKTILLTTRYLDEAEHLADRVAVFATAGSRPSASCGADRQRAGHEIRYRRNGREVVLQTEDPTRTLHELTGEALDAGVRARKPDRAAADARGGLPVADRGQRRMNLFRTS